MPQENAQARACEEEVRAPNNRLACMSGGLWIGMLCGDVHWSKIFAGFRVEQESVGGRIVKVTKVCVYNKKSDEYKHICKHHHGRATSATPWRTFSTGITLEGRTCQLFTL